MTIIVPEIGPKSFGAFEKRTTVALTNRLAMELATEFGSERQKIGFPLVLFTREIRRCSFSLFVPVLILRSGFQLRHTFRTSELVTFLGFACRYIFTADEKLCRAWKESAGLLKRAII